MIFGSVCSGIEAASVAWKPLGWKAAFLSEIEPFPRAVLQYHYKETPLHGDFTTIVGHEYGAVDVLIGGTPCQDFSVAGLRAGLDGKRGQLTIEFVSLLGRMRPRWMVWENVPGVLSIDGGRAFGTFLGALAKLGYGFAYRVLDAQFFGVPQRRRRVFVVGHSGDWRRAAAVLLERESLSRHLTPCGGEGEDTALCVTSRFGSGRNDPTAETYIAHTLRAEGFDASEDGTGRGIPLVPSSFAQNQEGEVRMSEVCGTLGTNSNASGRNSPLISFSAKDYGADAGNIAPTLRAMGHSGSHANAGGQLGIAHAGSVRRLTPRECERLQGFPDNYTLVPYRGKESKDGPRYKAIGNSMAVPVIRWLGERIEAVEAIP